MVASGFRSGITALFRSGVRAFVIHKKATLYFVTISGSGGDVRARFGRWSLFACLIFFHRLTTEHVTMKYHLKIKMVKCIKPRQIFDLL